MSWTYLTEVPPSGATYRHLLSKELLDGISKHPNLELRILVSTK
jgi:hypothetical protein